MTLWPRSLQGQLALRLAVMFVLASAAGIGLLLWQGSESADSLGLEMLRYRADELARHVVPAGHEAKLDLPPSLASLYGDGQGANLYVIRTGSGQMLTNDRDMSSLVAHWTITRAARNFRLEEFGPRQTDYYGLTIQEDSPAGPVAIAIAHSSDADAVAVAMLNFFARRIAWTIPVFALAMLLIGTWSIRAGLGRVAMISRRAEEISTRSADVRLPTEGLPSELLPLVQAVNSAFDRLQEGFAVQRRFTANAAHELRTPLTMLTAGLDELSGDAAAKLKADVARMNRLVSQLLQVARLDAVPIDVSGEVDLVQVAAEMVEYLAPWAIAQGRTIGLDEVAKSVIVTGNAVEISNAIRNLIENAVLHTPRGTEVTVAVSPEGAITITDRGPGVPADDRPKVFGRFWRGRGVQTPGAGLGLSIVAEIVRLHRGTVEVADGPGGGASFKLRFPRA